MKRAKRSRSVSFETELYRPIPNSEDEVEIEVEVSGSMTPYWGGDYDNPPEGGDVEDIEVTFWDESAKKQRRIPITKEEEQQFAMDLSEKAMDE